MSEILHDRSDSSFESSRGDPGNLVRTHTNPVQYLPFDILYAIFLICHAECPSLTFPTTASHVCHQWRSATIDSPVLWSFITFEHEKPSWEKYEVWLARSGDAPLTITLSSPPFERSSVKMLGRILHLIIPHTKRWSSITLDAVPEKIVRIAIDRMRVMPLPILQNIHLSIPRKKSRCQNWKPTEFLYGTPVLRHVVLRNVPINSASSFLSNLSTLEYHRTHNHAREGHPDVVFLAKFLLARSPKLHTLQIHYLPWRAQIPLPTMSPPLLHHHLRILDLSPSIPMAFFREIQTPALIHIESDGRQIPLPISTLQNIAQWPTGNGMTYVQFYTAQVPSPSHILGTAGLGFLPAALKALSGLERLEFRHVQFGAGKELVCLGSMCPRLQSLELRWCAGMEMEDLLQVVTARLKFDAVTHLLDLEVTDSHHQWPFAVDVSKENEMAAMGYEMVMEDEYRSYCWRYAPEKP